MCIIEYRPCFAGNRIFFKSGIQELLPPGGKFAGGSIALEAQPHIPDHSGDGIAEGRLRHTIRVFRVFRLIPSAPFGRGLCGTRPASLFAPPAGRFLLCLAASGGTAGRVRVIVPAAGGEGECYHKRKYRR